MSIEIRFKSLFDLVVDEAKRNPGFASRLEGALAGQSSSGQFPKGITEDCIKFNDIDRKIGINLVPLDSVRTIPRTGDLVDLPGEDGAGSGMYKVISVLYSYREDPKGEVPCPAKPLSVTVNVRAVRHISHRRARAVLDPFAVYEQSEEVLRQRLSQLDIELLKDIVAEHGMDSSRLAMKWKKAGRLIDLIVNTVRERSRKGDAFRSR